MHHRLSDQEFSDLAACVQLCIHDTELFEDWEFHTLFGFERAELERAWALHPGEGDAATMGMWACAVGQVLGYPGAFSRVPADVGERLPALLGRLNAWAG